MHLVRSPRWGRLLAAVLTTALGAGLAVASIRAAVPAAADSGLPKPVASQYKLDASTLYIGPTVTKPKVTLSLPPVVDAITITKILVNWGDSSIDTVVDPKADEVSHEYNQISGEDGYEVSVVEASIGSRSEPTTIGTVHVKHASAPKVTITKPKKANKVASWRTIKGKISYGEVDLEKASIALFKTRGTKIDSYYNGKRWVRFTTKTKLEKTLLTLLPLKQKGASAQHARGVIRGIRYVYPVKGLKKGHLKVRVIVTDKVGNQTTAARSQRLTR